MFDVIIGNPPYNKSNHIKFFNKSIDIIKENKNVLFIIPSTIILNKKKFRRKADLELIKYISKYKSEAIILESNIFEGVDIASLISIINIKKINYNEKKVDFIKYINGSIFKDVLIRDINITQIDPDIIKNIILKYKEYINNYGCLNDVLIKEKKEVNNGVCLSKITSHHSKEKNILLNFQKLITKQKEEIKGNLKNDFFIEHNKEREEIIKYIKNDFVSFGLFLYKFNMNNHMGELKGVPLFNFKEKFNEEKLIKELNLTKKEVLIIRSFKINKGL